MEISDFYHKKILIFCPHQDDEINLAGGLLLSLKKVPCTVKVVYSTNGDYLTDAKHRIKEAIKSLKKLGVPKENIIFMGYPDCFSSNETHLYMTNENWISPNGIKETYLPKEEEYHYQKHGKHAVLNKENFVADITEMIEEEMADILICVDYDEHSDHRALHLSFENAMGRILNQQKEYRPVVLKAFAYPTAFFGVNDFKTHHLGKTKFNRNKVSLYECYNPYYNWNKKISIDVSAHTRQKFLLKNPLFMAMTKHVSQPIYSMVYGIINSDQVFFRRRTDNLIYQADVQTSSGEAKYLRDFMTFDSSNIMNGETDPEIMDLGYMEFSKEDKEKKIQITFEEKVDIEEINIYQYVNCETKLTQIKLIVDNQEKVYNTEFKDYHYSLKDLALKQVEKVELLFENYEKMALTEIEIFSKSINYQCSLEEQEEKNTFWDKIIFKLDDFIIFMYKCIFKVLRDLLIKGREK